MKKTPNKYTKIPTLLGDISETLAPPEELPRGKAAKFE